jgi:hypothetical protein
VQSPPSLFQHIVSGASSTKPKSEPVTMPDAQRQTINALESTTTCEEQSFSVENLSITENPHEQWAFMHVSMYGADQYQIFLGASGIKFPQTTLKNRPNLVLGEMIQSEDSDKTIDPKNIWRLTKGYAIPNLIGLDEQLKRLCQHFANKAWYLVISDHTDFEIPWEMIKLPTPGYLGASFAVTRWHESHNFDKDKCSGNALAYVLDKLNSFNSEKDFLNNTFKVEPFCDIQRFCDELQENQAGYGLIYMACHSTFFQLNPQSLNEQGILNLTLGSLEDKTQQLNYLDLIDLPFNLLKQSQSIVFLNACHSGRSRVDDKFYRDSYRRGFAELFLTKGAAGVIGTLAQVNDTYAAKIAHSFIQASLQSPHMPIAVLLRNMRADAIKNLTRNSTEEEFFQFLYSFLYVYYGNPTTKLHLTKCEEPNNEPSKFGS